MGKKKKKKKQVQFDQGYDQRELDQIADCLEEYLTLYDRFIIREGVDEDRYKKAVKTIKKTIKKLRAGDGDAVFNQERYQELLERRRMIDE